jgi:hypothetical protein
MPNSDDEGDSCVLLGTALIDLMPGCILIIDVKKL